MEKTKTEKLKEFAQKFLKVKFGTEVVEKTPEQIKAEEDEKNKAGKFEAVKVKDGETMVEYNPSLEVGTPVMTSTGTGSVAATNGEWVLSNGIIFVVKDGKIESVTDDGTLDEPANSEVIEAMSAQILALEARVLAFETMFEKIDFAKIPTTEQILAFSKEVTDFSATVGVVIEELAAIPVNVPKTEEAEPEKVQGINFSAVAAKLEIQQAEEQ